MGVEILPQRYPEPGRFHASHSRRSRDLPFTGGAHRRVHRDPYPRARAWTTELRVDLPQTSRADTGIVGVNRLRLDRSVFNLNPTLPG